MSPFVDARSKSLLVAITLMVGMSPGCDDSTGDNFVSGPYGVIPEGITGLFTGSGTASAPNLVRLRGDAVGEDILMVEVVLGGPTTSDDLYAYAFDLQLSDFGYALATYLRCQRFGPQATTIALWTNFIASPAT